MKKALYSKRVLINGRLSAATIFIEDEKIKKVMPGKKEFSGFELEDFSNLVIMPGLIDSHVHINEPGRTEWEGFDTATKAAAAGGITTLVDMPLNASPVTTTRKNYKQKLDSTVGKLHVNCGFWGGLVPENADNITDILNTSVLGIKAFLTHSGIDDFANITESHLRKAMPAIAKSGKKLLVHAELDSEHDGIDEFVQNPFSYQSFVNSRPKKWENDAIELMIQLCEAFNCPVHIVHLASSDGLKLISKAKKIGLPISVETCPHYLYFCSENIPDKNPIYKCTPPIRDNANKEALWDGIESGIIDFVVTDHSPAPAILKELDSGNLMKAWGGIASLQFSLPVMWSEFRHRNFDIPMLNKLMSWDVAQFLGIENKKGKISSGYDADIVIWNPDEAFKAEENIIKYRHKISPYMGHSLLGVVNRTYVAGHLVYKNGEFITLGKGNAI